MSKKIMKSLVVVVDGGRIITCGACKNIFEPSDHLLLWNCLVTQLNFNFTNSFFLKILVYFIRCELLCQ